MPPRDPAPPRFAQVELVVEQIRKQLLALAGCDDSGQRQATVDSILDDLCEVEHLLAIHRNHL